MEQKKAKFAIGAIVKHKIHPFRGVIFDVDPTFSNTEEWWNSIPKNYRPKKINHSIISLLKMTQVIMLLTFQNKICYQTIVATQWIIPKSQSFLKIYLMGNIA